MIPTPMPTGTVVGNAGIPVTWGCWSRKALRVLLLFAGLGVSAPETLSGFGRRAAPGVVIAGTAEGTGPLGRFVFSVMSQLGELLVDCLSLLEEKGDGPLA